MKSTEAKSILVIVIGLVILGEFILHMRYLTYAGLLIGVLSLTFESLGVLLVNGWMKLGLALGYVNSRILLSIVFFVFLFPVAVLFRLFNKNPLQLKNDSDSMFINRNHQYGPKDLKNIW